MTEVIVQLGPRSYPIYVAPGALEELGRTARRHLTSQKVLVVTNLTISNLYGEAVRKQFSAAGFRVYCTEIPDGEEYKTLHTISRLYDSAVDGKLERGDTVVALGGGVVGDVAGFLAATYMRGVSFVQIPTTLLAQVDSSVGGKVGVNHPRGKNLIGAFYQPKFVLADVETLCTLPTREVRAGLAEVIKYGVIWDEEFFHWLVESIQRLLKLDAEALEHAVATSCSIKASVVSADEYEKGPRAVLNFGHTVGHALEAVTGYERFVHGEAVAIGMVVAARLAVNLGYLDRAAAEKIESLVSLAGLPLHVPAEIPTTALLDAMQQDKKVTGGELTFVLPERIGKVRIVRGIPLDAVRSVLRDRGSN